MPFYDYKCPNCGPMEISQSMKDEPLAACPECGSEDFTRCFSPPNVIMGGKQANQYNDVKGSKYWRDKNGVRHRVTSTDGDSKSPTATSKQYHSPEQVSALKEKDARKDQRKRAAASRQRTLQRAVKNVKAKLSK